MSAKRNQHIDGDHLLATEYVDKLLDMVELPENGTVSVIILGHDGDACMKMHFEPLTDEQMRNMDCWWIDADVHADTWSRRFEELIVAARHRWPEARIFRIPGCLCCNGIDNLLKYDCER